MEAGLRTVVLQAGRTSSSPRPVVTGPRFPTHWRSQPTQVAIGVRLSDQNLLRRAFVHPTFGDRPEATSKPVARALVRAGVGAAQSQARLEPTLKAKGFRKLLARIKRQPLPKDLLLCAPLECAGLLPNGAGPPPAGSAPA